MLSKAVYENYLNKLSETEKDILKVIMIFGKITPTELAKQTKKGLTNISAYYLKNLTNSKAVELVEKRGREKFYAVVPQIKWWKLEKSKEEIKKDEERERERKQESSKAQTNLFEFKF